MIIHAKNWAVTVDEDRGALYIQTSGNVPDVVNKACAELVKKRTSAAVAVQIFKTQFKNAIVSVEA